MNLLAMMIQKINTQTIMSSLFTSSSNKHVAIRKKKTKTMQTLTVIIGNNSFANDTFSQTCKHSTENRHNRRNHQLVLKICDENLFGKSVHCRS